MITAYEIPTNPTCRAFRNIKGKLYPAVSFDSGADGWQIAAVFRNGPSGDFLFQGSYDGPNTLERPKLPELLDDYSDNYSDDDYSASEDSA